jgi:hypothetical protein
MSRDTTPFEDALQIGPSDLDRRIFDVFRGGAPAPATTTIDSSAKPQAQEEEVRDEESAVVEQSSLDDDEGVIDSPTLFSEPAPRERSTLVRIITSTPVPNGGAWTIPLVCFGIGIIALALIIPAASENRRLVWEREKLARDLAHVQKQIAINDEFLARLASDPGLAERLAQRQMKMVREGTSVLHLPGREAGPEVSPFELVTLPPPPPMPEFTPIGGRVSRLFDHPKVRLYLLGAGLLSLIVGVILGSTNDRRPSTATIAA